MDVTFDGLLQYTESAPQKTEDFYDPWQCYNTPKSNPLIEDLSPEELIISLWFARYKSAGKISKRLMIVLTELAKRPAADLFQIQADIREKMRM